MASSDNYQEFLKKIEGQNFAYEGFKVEYFITHNDSTPYTNRLEQVRDIGYRITGFPQYKSPKITFGLCFIEGHWYFGKMHFDELEWLKHKSKPFSYSNSINGHIAKALINVATRGEKSMVLLDACCGVGTIMLEACFAQQTIEGCDINWKVCKDAKENLLHFQYFATVHNQDIASLKGPYDAVIIDLPYNLYSTASDEDVLHIILSSAQLANRLVIVSNSDISDTLNGAQLSIVDHCTVGKYGKKNFERQIWICENNTLN